MMPVHEKAKTYFIVSGLSFLLFALFILGLCVVDVQTVAATGSPVGFATLNFRFSRAFPPNALFYLVSEIIGYAAFFVVGAFGLLGLCEWIKRRKLSLVDRDLYVLLGLYILILFFYLFFAAVNVNDRPILIDGSREASFPSSHTMLAIVVFFSGYTMCKRRNERVGQMRYFLPVALTVTLCVVCRLLSGMHWLTDVLGAVILSSALLFAFWGTLALGNTQ